MKVDPVIKQAARSLREKLVQPLEIYDLYQVASLALWERGQGKGDAHRYTIAKSAMIDEIRRHRWCRRMDGSYKPGPIQMENYDSWEGGPDGATDCHAASLVAVRQFIANLHKVSGRRREVLDGLIAGLTHREIAGRMGVQEFAVTYHMKALREFAARYV